jgi:hypothetical protein
LDPCRPGRMISRRGPAGHGLFRPCDHAAQQRKN